MRAAGQFLGLGKRLWGCFSLGCLLFACTGQPVSQKAVDYEKLLGEDALRKVTENGPIKATVRVGPKDPKVGDVLVLELRVEAKKDVDVRLPGFGEALGQFSIVDFKEQNESLGDDLSVQVQRYRLQAPLSGKHRIPQLRLSFVDRRSGEKTEEKELLTDEVPLTVVSVLNEDADTLRPAQPALAERWLSFWLRRYGPLGAVVLGLVLAVLFFFVFRKKQRQIRTKNAYEVARARLQALESSGFPTEDTMDAWYVELSSIVRRYLEDRYELRAPELTTEEFLQTMRQSDVLNDEHRRLLGEFLSTCDRVKFAGYRPDDSESKTVLSQAETFLSETRPDPGEALPGGDAAVQGA